MKARFKGTKDILDRALNLETESELYVGCKTEHEMDVLYSDLKQQRLRLIGDDNLVKYEQIIIDKKHLNRLHNIILTKLNIQSAYVRKKDGSKEDITL